MTASLFWLHKKENLEVLVLYSWSSLADNYSNWNQSKILFLTSKSSLDGENEQIPAQSDTLNYFISSVDLKSTD